jgi:hypothetical protein
MSTNNRELLEYCFPVGANLLREAQASLTSDKYAYVVSTSYREPAAIQSLECYDGGW